jgi:hypothetical protein
MAEEHENASIASAAPYPRQDPEKSPEEPPKIAIYEAMGKGSTGSKGSNGSKGKKTIIILNLHTHNNCCDSFHKITANLLIITLLIIFVRIQTL